MMEATDGALTSTPNWSRIPIRIASASEADDDELPDDDFFFGGYEPSDPPEASTWSAPPARPVQETMDVEPTSPPARWRCLKCDSTNLTEIGTMQWRCRDSTREEFYKDDQDPEPSLEGDNDPEQAESEQRTNDPVVDREDMNVGGAAGGDQTWRDSNSSPTSWNSKKGPMPGVKWKSGQPPAVPQWKYDQNDMRAYAKFRKKTDIWKLQMESYASKKDQALLLYAGLTGELEQELEHLDMSQIHKDDGVEVIMELLKKPFEQRLTNQKRRFLHEFETFRCQGETMRGYVQRFRRVQRSLTAVGVNISGTFDADSLGSRLFDRSGLSHQDQKWSEDLDAFGIEPSPALRNPRLRRKDRRLRDDAVLSVNMLRCNST
ncbi:unnamed protein product [Durusdinium trenchii]|uniref:Retrotransposon gag domain-containing protein n=1 Tax=Durusdinium trenchii TaxID=1381693 RepID=A0ABP0HEM2_9DINO